MKPSTKSRIERLEKLIAIPSVPPTQRFDIVDMGEWPDAARAEYDAAFGRGDSRECNRLMETFAGIPMPPPIRRRRRSGRPLRVVQLVIDHLDDEPEPIDERDSRVRTMRDGSEIVVTTPQTEPAADPNEIVGYGPNGYPESRAQRVERLKRAGQSSYQAFDSRGRPI